MLRTTALRSSQLLRRSAIPVPSVAHFSVPRLSTATSRVTSDATPEEILTTLRNPDYYKYIHWGITKSSLVDGIDVDSEESSVGACRISMGYSPRLSIDVTCNMAFFAPNTIKVGGFLSAEQP